MLIKVEELPETIKEYRFLLTDSQFTLNASLTIPIPYKDGWDTYPSFAPRTVVVIKNYLDRNLPVAPNVARLYCWLVNTDEFRYGASHLYAIRNWIDTYYPQLQYGDKHFFCVLRYLKTLDFVYGKKLIKV